MTLEFNELRTQKSGEIYFVLNEKQGDEFSKLVDMIATHDMPVKECQDQTASNYSAQRKMTTQRSR